MLRKAVAQTLTTAFLILAASTTRGQSWYGLQENGLEPNYRNQYVYSTCWAFATMASVESNLIKEALLPQSTAGLSERDLTWHTGFGVNPNDPLNGGLFMMSAANFARGDGPLLNSQAPYWSDPSGTGGACGAASDPYPNSTTPAVPPFASRPAAPYYVRDIEWLHTVGDIKYAVLNYGAVAAGWASNAGTWYGPSGHWNAPATYQPVSAGWNEPSHAIAIVGWDDNWVTTGGTGAWLARNSFGTYQQHFGISYNDFYCGSDSPDVGSQNMGAVSFHNVVPNTFQKIYYHNDLGWTGQQAHAYAFNHFTSAADGSLKAVSFYTTDDSVGYTVNIYTRYQNGVLGNLATTTSGTIAHEGLHTIDLPSLVLLPQGQDFFIELQTSNGQQANDGNVRLSGVNGGYSDPLATTTALAGESFFSDNGTNWTDLQTLDRTANFAINGLTLDGMSVAWTAAVSGSWSASGNWSGSVPNSARVAAVLNASTTSARIVTLDGPQKVGSLTLGNSASTSLGYTLSGTGTNSLTLDNSARGASITVNDGRHVIDAPIVLADNLTVTGSGTLILGEASHITQTGVHSLTMSGTGGRLVLDGSNSYSGGTMVTAGTLQIGNTFALGTAELTVDGGAVDLAGYGPVVAGLAGRKGTIFNGSTNGSILTINQASTTTFGGTLENGSGILSLVKTGSGKLWLTGANTYSGGTMLQGGTLVITNSSSLGASGSRLTIGHATLEVADNIGSSQAIDLADAGATIQVDPSLRYSNSGIMSGTGGLSKTGSGLLILSGTNTYSGGTTVVGGTLVFASSQAIGGSGANVHVHADATVAAGYPIDQNFLSRLSHSSSGVVALGADSAENLDLSDFHTLRLGATGRARYSGTLTPSGTTYRLGGGGGTLTIISPLTGDNDLNIDANGTLPGAVILAATNTFRGGTTITNGTLILASNSALLNGSSLTLGPGGTLIFDPATAPAPAFTSTVPEPSSLSLLAAGVLGMLGCARRRRQ